MKTKNAFWYLISLTMVASAWAQEPKAKDYAVYESQMTDAGQITSRRWSKEIIEVSVDHSAYVVKWHDQDGSDQTASIAPFALGYIEDLQKFCDLYKNSGFTTSLEQLQTPMGTFHTCRLERPNHTEWLSNEVPFGLVKEVQILDGGLRIEQRLVEFGW